jgi:predicted ABC-class ATPase
LFHVKHTWPPPATANRGAVTVTTLAQLAARLAALEGRGYPAYKEIRGAYTAPDLTLHIDHVQGDPFAEPSRFRAVLTPAAAGLPPWALASPPRLRAAADFLNRALADAFQAAAPHAGAGTAGAGRSGELRVLRPGQEVLARTALLVRADGAVEARFRVGLPARGRRILGQAAARLVGDSLPTALRAALIHTGRHERALRRHVETVEDAAALRGGLAAAGLVAFVGDGSILPRRSGVDERPLAAAQAVPFQAPPGLALTLTRPNGGPIRGLGVPRGVTLIVGGGFHGKSTLLRALERGVYDHVPGDGRELVVTVASAAKVRAEDGRAVTDTDISNFINRLPGGQGTEAFTTANASGSTSQAAGIIEALAAGAECLLLDEDTSATNFMIRDARMQALIAEADEPITPFIDRVQALAREAGTSTVLVVGGSGDYFDVADTVLALRSYRAAEVTAAARRVARERPTGRQSARAPWRPPAARRVALDRLDPGSNRRAVELRIRARDRMLLGREEVDLAGLEQVVEEAQTRALARAVSWAAGTLPGVQTGLPELIAAVMRAAASGGLDAFQPEPTGELAEFRAVELVGLLGRLRMLGPAG